VNGSRQTEERKPENRLVFRNVSFVANSAVTEIQLPDQPVNHPEIGKSDLPVTTAGTTEHLAWRWNTVCGL